MFRSIRILILVLITIPNAGISQSKENLEAINDVWYEFYEAFDSLDYKLMAEIHSKDLVRISGGERIIDYETYINNYKKTFDKAKKENLTNKISLRFFERINNDSTASERGIYKLVRNENKPDEQAYYGQFHVILKKEHGFWKIFMDYDSNYENSIGESEFMESHDIKELHHFINE